MNSMAHLKTFNVQELFELLKACAQNLAHAYQKMNEKSLYFTSEQAYDACDYLMYEISKQQTNQTIH